MSEFTCCNISNLWDEILKRHWSYLETEEGKQKLEEYKKLEACLKDFLSVVRHDRKFFLPETMQILQNSIRNLENFNINKAIAAFEAISQYANNLFTKPWRKEFCIVKVYSGFYQHEIRQNLIEAEKLFEAMGYRCLSNQILTLDGPICPDQVTNVSRDAMAAYMELNIIKYIYNGLETMGLSCNWNDIYCFREMHVGGITQTINSLSCLLKRRLNHNEKCLLLENGYSYIEPLKSVQLSSPAVAAVVDNRCQCNGYCNQSPLPSQLSRGEGIFYNNNTFNCNHNENTNNSLQMQALHKNFGKTAQHEPDDTIEEKNTPNHRNGHNMEYNGQSNKYNIIPTQCHSHEQQLRTYNSPHVGHPHCLQPYKHYDQLYESLDGNSLDGRSNITFIPDVTASSNASNEIPYIHPYNVPGNRYPLTYLSQQLSNHYDGHPIVAGNVYATVSKNHNNYKMPIIYNSVAPNSQIIYLNNPANYPINTHYEHNEANDQTLYGNRAGYRRQCDLDLENYIIDKKCDNHTIKINGFPMYYPTYNNVDKLALNDQVYMFPRPYHKEKRIIYKQRYDNPTSKTSTYYPARPKSNSLQLNCREDFAKEDVRKKNAYHMSVEQDTVSDQCCDSTRDYFSNGQTIENEKRCQAYSPIQLSRNQDGVGSFESWDYVFQNLERNENHKNFIDEDAVIETNDPLMHNIDFNSLNLVNNSSHSVSSGTLSGKHAAQISDNLSEKAKITTKPLDKIKTNKTQQGAQYNANPTNEQKNSFGKNKTKPSTKYNNLLTDTKETKTNNFQASVQEYNINNNNNVIENQSMVLGRGTQVNQSKQQSDQNSSDSNKLQISTIQATITNPNEWSCHFCTFLNPDTKRVCQMCCRTNDLNLIASSKCSTRSPSPRCI